MYVRKLLTQSSLGLLRVITDADGSVEQQPRYTQRTAIYSACLMLRL